MMRSGGCNACMQHVDAWVHALSLPMTHTIHTMHAGSMGQNSVLNVLNSLRGPWTVVFWHPTSATLWFGRDVMGECETGIQSSGLS